MASRQRQVERRLRQSIQEKGGLKWYMSVTIRFRRENANGETEYATAHFTSRCAIAHEANDLELQIQKAFMKCSMILWNTKGKTVTGAWML